MKLMWGSLACAAAATCLLAVGAPNASAADLFSQSHGSSSGWSSQDFVPSAGSIKLGTSCSTGGTARYSYVSLFRTSSQSQVGTGSYSYPCGTGRSDDPRVKGTAPGGAAYYLKWHGQNSSLQNGYTAPSSAAYAYR